MQTKTFLRSIVAALVAVAPLTGFAKDRDHHGDRDHHNDRGDHGRRYDRDSHHGGHSYYSHGRYYGGGYGYRGYGYGYGGYGYGGYGYRSYGPSVGISFYSRPNYVYRGYVDNGGDSLSVDVQRALRRRGFYYGPIDGSIGPASRAAIRAYQANRGLYITGRVDRTLVRSLGIS